LVVLAKLLVSVYCVSGIETITVEESSTRLRKATAWPIVVDASTVDSPFPFESSWVSRIRMELWHRGALPIRV
jgi:hypothetical protein